MSPSSYWPASSEPGRAGFLLSQSTACLARRPRGPDPIGTHGALRAAARRSPGEESDVVRSGRAVNTLFTFLRRPECSPDEPKAAFLGHSRPSPAQPGCGSRASRAPPGGEGGEAPRLGPRSQRKRSGPAPPAVWILGPLPSSWGQEASNFWARLFPSLQLQSSVDFSFGDLLPIKSGKTLNGSPGS